MSAWNCEFGGDHAAAVFCACRRSLPKLCSEHSADHQRESRRAVTHTMYPIEAATDYLTPGYMRRLEQRENARHYAVQELRGNLTEVDRCTAAFTAEVEKRIERLRTHRETALGELAAVKEALQREIDECEKEVERCRFLDHPHMTSKYTPFVRNFTKNRGELTVFHYHVETADCAVGEILRYQVTAPSEKPQVEKGKTGKTLILSDQTLQLMKDHERLQQTNMILEGNMQSLKSELREKCEEFDAKMWKVDQELRTFAIPSLSDFEIESLFKQSWLIKRGLLPPEFLPYSSDSVHITSVRKLPVASEVVSRFLRYSRTLSPANCRLLWHGTGRLMCKDGECGRGECSCCGVSRSGVMPEYAREGTASFAMFGRCAYFSSRSINSHSYNGQSEDTLGRGERAMLLCCVALGNSLDLYEYTEDYATVDDKRQYFRSRMGRDPLEREAHDCWPRSLSPRYNSFHAYMRSNELFDNYMVPLSSQVLPLYLVTYRYPEVLREKLPPALQGQGTAWCQFHRMRHSSEGHTCDYYQGYVSHFAGADFCTEKGQNKD